jgi:transposase-like protein
MQQHQYSEEFKKSAVQKILLRKGKTVEQICSEIGISSPSFYEWRKKCANASGMKNKERSPQDWSAAEKFKAVMDFDHLNEQAQGEFLRRFGLHTDHILSWKKLMQAGLEPVKKLTAEERAERAEDRRKIKELERDLNQKDRALASVTALLVLKKKANLIWGTGEDE